MDKMPNITKNIKVIEKLKSELLGSVADLFAVMLEADADQDREEALANILILTYMLGDKIGLSYQALDGKVLNRIKLGLLSQETGEDYKQVLLLLSKHMDKYRDF